MPTIPQSKLPKPKDWDEFEHIAWDLYTRLWDDPNAKRYGRSGQAQQGVDIYGKPARLAGGYAGVQCKCYEPGGLTEAIVKDEIKKAEAFKPALDEYTIATTSPLDAKLQEVLRHINEERQKADRFPICIDFWDDLWSHLSHPDNRDLLRKHYGDWFLETGTTMFHSDIENGADLETLRADYLDSHSPASDGAVPEDEHVRIDRDEVDADFGCVDGALRDRAGGGPNLEPKRCIVNGQASEEDASRVSDREDRSRPILRAQDDPWTSVNRDRSSDRHVGRIGALAKDQVPPRGNFVDDGLQAPRGEILGTHDCLGADRGTEKDRQEEGQSHQANRPSA